MTGNTASVCYSESYSRCFDLESDNIIGPFGYIVPIRGGQYYRLIDISRFEDKKYEYSVRISKKRFIVKS